MKIDGEKALQAKLRAMAPSAKREIRKALDKSATEMRQAAQTLAPVDDGDLRDSIRVEDGAHELQVRVIAGGKGAPYAGFVEHGTGAKGSPSGAAPRPYFYPAYRLLRKRIRGRINRAQNKAARAVASRGY